MFLPRLKNEWTEMVIISVVSFFLYQMNMIILFCIPLQILYVRKGERLLFFSGISVLAALAIAALIRTAPVAEPGIRQGLLAIDILLPACFIVGLGAVDLEWKVPLRRFYKVILVTAVAGVLSIPAIYLLGRNESISTLIKVQIEAVSQIFAGAVAETPSEATLGGLFSDPDKLVETIKGILLRNYLFIFYIILSGSTWVGTSFGNRTMGKQPRRFVDFRLPEKLIWPLLFSWALVLLDIAFDIGVIKYAAWNLGLIFLLTYGMQGVGILQTILQRRNVPRGIRMALVFAMVLMLFWPGVNFIIIIGLPVLGISELWVHYRTSQKEQNNNEDG